MPFVFDASLEFVSWDGRRGLHVVFGDGKMRVRRGPAALAARVAALGFEQLALLPYNPTWLPKRRSLGLELPYACESWMSTDHIARCEATVAAAGLQPVR